MSAPEPQAQTPALKWQARAIEKAFDALLLGLPFTLAMKLWERVAGAALREPAQALWVLIPAAALAVAAFRALTLSQLRLNDWRSRGFLLLFMMLFTEAARVDVLDWNRKLTLLRDEAPRRWLTPARLGDWRYALVRAVPASPPQLLIVTTHPRRGMYLNEARSELAALVRYANDGGARGIAFDFHLDGASDVDAFLCATIRRSAIPVVFGRALTTELPARLAELPADIRNCRAPNGHTGHLAGFADWDRRVRMIPLLLYGDHPALSLEIAALMSPGAETPPREMLRFVEPAPGSRPPAIRYQDLATQTREERTTTVQDRFLLAGDESEFVDTPFGRKLGVEIHADAVHSLRDRTFIRALPSWTNGLTIFAICYWMIAMARAGRRGRHLAGVAAGVSAGMTVLSAVAIAATQVWVEVVYPVAAAWLLVPVLLGLRRAERSRVQPRTAM